MKKVLESCKVYCNLIPQSLANNTALDSTLYIDASKYDRVVAIGTCVALGAATTDSLRVDILEASSTAGVGKATVANATDTMASAGDTGEVAVEVRTEELGTVGNFVGMRLLQVNAATGAKYVAGVILLCDAKEQAVTQSF